jgi:hypothetical protein
LGLVLLSGGECENLRPRPSSSFRHEMTRECEPSIPLPLTTLSPSENWKNRKKNSPTLTPDSGRRLDDRPAADSDTQGFDLFFELNSSWPPLPVPTLDSLHFCKQLPFLPILERIAVTIWAWKDKVKNIKIYFYDQKRKGKRVIYLSVHEFTVF